MPEMHILPIVALFVLSLVQCASADPRPEFALAVSVSGTSRVSLAASGATDAVAEINVAVQNYLIQSELQLLPDVAEIMANIANQFQTLGAAAVSAISALASDASGDIAGVFGVALDAVNAAIDFADDTLPGLRDPLVTLVGTALSDKLLDSFQHLGKGLQALLVSLTTLKSGAETAVAEAGSSNVPANIVSRNLPRARVTELISALHLLKGTVPLLEYVVTSTMENIGLADDFMLQLDDKVDSIIGESSTLLLELNDFLDPLENTILNTLSSIGGELTNLVAEFGGLSNVATVSDAAALGTTLGDFKANLEDLATADPTISSVLDQLNVAFTDAYDIVDPLYYIYDSALVDALMTTLVANGNYAQYCFYKYKDFFFVLLDLIALEASECIAEEAERMEYYQRTVELMLTILFYDFVDISDDLAICERIDDADNLQECIAKFVSIYTDLEAAFGDKLTLLYQSLQHEIAASGNRLKICIRFSQSELSDTQVPLLLAKINECAMLGPYAEDD
uniref:Protein TsetseEP domain-containing protein n=1 Tax=Anopheles atroparvus TaxID=41427 RepID=A0A182IX29_ANOAO